MKFSEASLATVQLSEMVKRQRITGEKLECIIYSYEPGAKFAVHQHEAEQLTVVLEGELVFTFDDEDVQLLAGEAVLIPGNTPHGAFVPKDALLTKTYNIFSPVRTALPGA